VKRQPHVRPLYLPPAEPPRESFASLLLGAAFIVGVLALVLFLVPALAS